MEKYMIKWNRFRRQTMVLTAPELLALAELLREMDQAVDRGTPMYHWSVKEEGIRSRLENLLGMHPGSLDTSRGQIL